MLHFLFSLLFWLGLFISTPLAVAENREDASKDPAIVQMCIKDFYIKCGEGMGVFISPNQVLTAYHVVSTAFQTNDSVKGVVFFRHPKQPHIKVEFNRIIMASAVDDMMVLEVTDYTSENFYPLVEEEVFEVGEEVFLKRFPKRAVLPFISIPVSVIDSNQYNLGYYMVAELPHEYDLRGMSGGPVLVDSQLLGIVSKSSNSNSYITLVDASKINNFNICDNDHSCIKTAMRILYEEADKENIIAQYHLAMKYYYGVEIEQDIEKAQYWYDWALSNGYLEFE